MGDLIWMRDFMKKSGKKPSLFMEGGIFGKTLQTQSQLTGSDAVTPHTGKPYNKHFMMLIENCTVARGHNASLRTNLLKAQAGLTPRLLMGDLLRNILFQSEEIQTHLNSLDSTLISLAQEMNSNTETT